MTLKEINDIIEKMEQNNWDDFTLFVRCKRFPKGEFTKFLGYSCRVMDTNQDEHGKYMMCLIPKKALLKTRSMLIQAGAKT